jgi:hypothetical protein
MQEEQDGCSVIVISAGEWWGRTGWKSIRSRCGKPASPLGADEIRERRREGTYSLFPYGREVHVKTSYDSILKLVRSRNVRSQVVCFRCGESGHKKSECFYWKVKRCWNKFDCDEEECSFAHSDSEMRTPWVSKCIRIVKREGVLITHGCYRTGHTYKQCPFRSESACAEAPTSTSPQERTRETPAAGETRCIDCSRAAGILSST